MNEEFRRVDIEILKDFMDGEEHDVYLLIKKLYLTKTFFHI